MTMFDRRYRGFRVVNFAACGVLVVLMFGVYWAKTRAATDSSSITSLDRQIAHEQREIRTLQATLAQLETPERISRLSGEYLGMAPIQATHEAAPEQLPEIAGKVRTASILGAAQ